MIKLVLIFITCLILLASTATGYVAYLVFSGDVFGDGAKLQKDRILQILARETLVYDTEGRAQLGSLFADEHRIYVNIQDIPQVMKDAIISSEDESFYENFGVDPKGILRALWHNLRNDSRQGASTITQQTVKNLYGREKTDLMTKFYETIDAIKMERLYTKDQILEFYLNQFHVVGNGRGVGVAARYYFDKYVSELDLVEAAFIAGSVKGPDKYNPFTKTSEKLKEKALQEANERKNYVLMRLFETGKISKLDYNEAFNTPVPFRQGRFQFNELAITDFVTKQLSEPEVLEALGVFDVNALANMGLRIITTIRADIQKAAQYGVRKNLSELQMLLTGFTPEDQSRFTPIQKPEAGGFYVARVENINAAAGSEQLTVQLSSTFSCVVHADALLQTATVLARPTYREPKTVLRELMSKLKESSHVLVSLPLPDFALENSQTEVCHLETRPKVQGAAMVLDQGSVIAMVGGYAPNEYNRALVAKRQPGSTFKLPVYYAALQLGWNMNDTLANVRNMFHWQNQFYFPRPDHVPDTLRVSIKTAGAKSENIASVWLARHLLDHLNEEQFVALIKYLVDDPLAQVSEDFFVRKLTEIFNVSLRNESQIREGILDRWVSTFTPHSVQEEVWATTLHYGGDNFEQQALIIKRDTALSANERQVRLEILKNQLVRWQQLAHEASSDLVRGVTQRMAKLAGSDRQWVYLSPTPWNPQTVSPLVTAPKVVSLTAADREYLITNPLRPEELLLDGVVTLGTVQDLTAHIEDRLVEIKTLPPLNQLSWNADFRYSLGLYYVSQLTNRLGIREPINWVPSLPLGANDLTLTELALLYQSFQQGKTYRYFSGNHVNNQILMVKRVENSEGDVLWEARQEESRIVEDAISAPTLEILRATVTEGTAKVLDNAIILRSSQKKEDQKLMSLGVRVPNFGKTGTTNNYTNGTYIGFLPYPKETPQIFGDSSYNLSRLGGMYTIATYVGYDDNTPMTRPGFRAYGWAATPAWREVALALIRSDQDAHKLTWDPQGTIGQEIAFQFDAPEQPVNENGEANDSAVVERYISFFNKGQSAAADGRVDDQNVNRQESLSPAAGDGVESEGPSAALPVPQSRDWIPEAPSFEDDDQ